MENPLFDCAMNSYDLVLENIFPALVSDTSFNTVAALVPIFPVTF